MNIQAVLFDLDGTLADTAIDLGGALNALLRAKGLPEKTLAEIRPYASHGSGALVQFGASITPEHADFETWRQDYLAQYDLCFDKDTELFPEINTLIAELAARGIAWGIITNKPARFTDRLIPKLNLIVPPDVVVSGDTCGEAKPSTKPMLYACQQINISPENCLYIGDAERDMLAGHNAGMKTVLAEWGYISQSDDIDSWLWDFSIQQPLDVLHLLTPDGERHYHD